MSENTKNRSSRSCGTRSNRLSTFEISEVKYYGRDHAEKILKEILAKCFTTFMTDTKLKKQKSSENSKQYINATSNINI